MLKFIFTRYILFAVAVPNRATSSFSPEAPGPPARAREEKPLQHCDEILCGWLFRQSSSFQVPRAKPSPRVPENGGISPLCHKFLDGRLHQTWARKNPGTRG